jgi:hypothetical protein
MKRGRFFEEEMADILKLAVSLSPSCQEIWSRRADELQEGKRFVGMSTKVAKRLRLLEYGNKRLEKIIAGRSLSIEVMKEVVQKYQAYPPDSSRRHTPGVADLHNAGRV